MKIQSALWMVYGETVETLIVTVVCHCLNVIRLKYNSMCDYIHDLCNCNGK